MATTKDSEDSKVMDVAKPGASKPDVGSKPMVVGHKSILSDPDVKTAEPANTDAVATGQTMSSRDKVTIQPLSSNESSKAEDDSKTDKPQDEKEDTKEEAKDETKEDTTSDVKETEETTEKKSDADIAADEEQAKLEKEAQLQEIVKSKKYYVPIKAKGATSVKTFAVTFIIVSLLGVLIIAVLVDAEIIDLGIELPFDLL